MCYALNIKTCGCEDCLTLSPPLLGCFSRDFILSFPHICFFILPFSLWIITQVFWSSAQTTLAIGFCKLKCFIICILSALFCPPHEILYCRCPSSNGKSCYLWVKPQESLNHFSQQKIHLASLLDLKMLYSDKNTWVHCDVRGFKAGFVEPWKFLFVMYPRQLMQWTSRQHFLSVLTYPRIWTDVILQQIRDEYAFNKMDNGGRMEQSMLSWFEKLF